jgi:hypothetical protein
MLVRRGSECGWATGGMTGLRAWIYEKLILLLGSILIPTGLVALPAFKDGVNWQATFTQGELMVMSAGALATVALTNLFRLAWPAGPRRDYVVFYALGSTAATLILSTQIAARLDDSGGYVPTSIDLYFIHVGDSSPSLIIVVLCIALLSPVSVASETSSRLSFQRRFESFLNRGQ